MAHQTEYLLFGFKASSPHQVDKGLRNGQIHVWADDLKNCKKHQVLSIIMLSKISLHMSKVGIECQIALRCKH
jgi:hypothetical protein